MFDIGASELLMIAVVAIVVIGPKDMPAALRTAGRWMGKMRKMSAHFRSGIDAMIREAEMEEMEKKWREQNDRVMREFPGSLPTESEMAAAPPPVEPPSGNPPESADASQPQEGQPQLPLDKISSGS